MQQCLNDDRHPTALITENSKNNLFGMLYTLSSSVGFFIFLGFSVSTSLGHVAIIYYTKRPACSCWFSVISAGGCTHRAHHWCSGQRIYVDMSTKALSPLV
jgi:hypothetical protein